MARQFNLRPRRSWSSAFVTVILLSYLCATPGASYFAVWLIFREATGFPEANPSLATQNLLLWADRCGWMSLVGSAVSVVVMVAANLFGRVRFYLWLVPASAMVGTLVFYSRLWR